MLFFFFFNFIYLFIYFWLCWVFVSVWGLSLVAASGGHSSSRCVGLSLSRPLLSRSTGSRRAGSVVVAHGLSRSAACGIFPDQGSNPVPCIGRRILNHCATREAPWCSLYSTVDRRVQFFKKRKITAYTLSEVPTGKYYWLSDVSGPLSYFEVWNVQFTGLADGTTVPN